MTDIIDIILYLLLALAFFNIYESISYNKYKKLPPRINPLILMIFIPGVVAVSLIWLSSLFKLKAEILILALGYLFAIVFFIELMHFLIDNLKASYHREGEYLSKNHKGPSEPKWDALKIALRDSKLIKYIIIPVTLIFILFLIIYVMFL